MLDAGGGGGGTNWSGMDVRQMWAMVEGQQTDPHWKLVAGWRKTFELTSMHLYRLKDYRERLAEAWPPERNSASAAYMTHLDYLISHVQLAFDAAVANYDAFSGATGAISSARYELKKIYDEYHANQTKLDEYANQLAVARSPASSGLPQPSPGPSPIPSGRQEQLNYQARSLMYSLSSELTQATAAIRQPPPYTPPAASFQDESAAYGGGGNVINLPPPPLIPPVITTATHPSSALPAPTPTPFQSTTTPTGTGPGPILGGVGTGNPTLPPQMPTVPPPPPTSGIIGPPLPPTVPPAMKPPSGGLIGNPSPGLKPNMRTAMPLTKPMPPGGVIGPVGQPVTSQPGAIRPTAGRANPVGGVIGQRPGAGPAVGPGTRPTVLGTSNTGAAQTGRAGQRRTEDEERDQHWNPDNPWETDEGVLPVVLPPPQAGRIDPGPAIGLNR